MPRPRVYPDNRSRQAAYRRRSGGRERRPKLANSPPRPLTAHEEIDRFARFAERAKVAARKHQAWKLLACLVQIDDILEYMRRYIEDR
jgi:hypothetical protein